MVWNFASQLWQLSVPGGKEVNYGFGGEKGVLLRRLIVWSRPFADQQAAYAMPSRSIRAGPAGVRRIERWTKIETN